MQHRLSSGKTPLIQECSYYSEEELKKYNITMCDICRSVEMQEEKAKESYFKKIKCHFCNKREGVLLKLHIKQEKWAHTNCIRWYIFLKMTRENGFVVFKSEQEICDKTWLASDCEHCKKTLSDFFIKCSNKNCERYFHSKCASSQNVEELVLDKFKYKLFKCAKHGKKYFDIAKGKELEKTRTYGKNVNSNNNTSANIKYLPIN
jgi:hypothetical protein